MATASNELGPNGIPKTPFVEDVDAFMKDKQQSAENVLSSLEENHQKYKFMESNLNTKKTRLRTKIPDIKASLDIVKFLKTKREKIESSGDNSSVKLSYQLSDNVYAKASVMPNDKICLWLGANVMLEYTLDDAEVLLEKNSKNAAENTISVDNQLAFIRDQLTTIEVNMARVYNWDVKRRQEQGLLAK